MPKPPDDEFGVRARRSLLALAPQCRAFGDGVFGFSGPDDPDRAALHRGALVAASVVGLDQLFDDLEALGAASEKGREFDFEQSGLLGELPRRFRRRYTEGFARRFLLAYAAVGTRLAQPHWSLCATVAEELALRLLVDQAQVHLEAAGVDADFARFEDVAFEDFDHEYLFAPGADGFEDDPALAPLGMAPMGFAWWFVPFNDTDRFTSPFLVDPPPDAAP